VGNTLAPSAGKTVDLQLQNSSDCKLFLIVMNLWGIASVCIEQIGNSVPPQLGRILALSILEQVMGVTLPFPMHYLPASKKLGFRQRKRQLTEVYAQKAKKR
jgi:hypothetical protein